MSTLQERRQTEPANHMKNGARWYWFAPSRGKSMACLLYESETDGILYLLNGPFDTKAEAEASA